MPDTAQASSANAGSRPADLPWLKAYPAGVDWHQTFEAGPLHGLLDAAVARYPAQVCTYFLGRTMTYAAIGRAVEHAAVGLQKLGVGKGVKVGLFLPNSPTFIVAYFAVLKAGGTVVNYNPLYSIPELEHQVKDSGTSLMVTLDLKLLLGKVETLLASGALERAVVASFSSLLPTVKSMLFRLTRGQEIANVEASPLRSKIVLQAELMANDGRPAPVEIDPASDLAVLQYTGGTTGTPKGAALTHANLSIQVAQISAWTAPMGDGVERIMSILPFFHVFAMSFVMNYGLKRGAQLILVPRFEISEAVRLINQLRPTILPGVPTLFNALLNYKGARKADLSSVQYCLSGGAALPGPVKRDFEAMTGGIVIEAYGLSETSPAVTANPVVGQRKDGSIGLPLPATLVTIRSLEDPRVEVPAGDTGEICVCGPQVMAGYWNKPEDTRDSFVTDDRGRHFRTGDIGHMDADGYTFISDRLKDMINASGFKIYPARIEEALYAHPAVEEAAVIGVPDAYRGEAPKAFVKLRAGQTASAEDLLEFLKPRLAKTELPAAIEFRGTLPKTAVGKMSKKELKAEEAAKRG